MKKLILFAAVFIAVTSCNKTDDNWGEPVIPVSLKGIEAVNVDNSGEFPVVSVSPVKKEAYMIGVRWIADNVPSDDDKFITGPIQEGRQTYASISNPYSKAIMCLTPFNADIPAGKYVSKYFKEMDRNYLPADVDEGYVLLVAPDPGMHSFRVEYYEGEELRFSYDTQTIEFF